MLSAESIMSSSLNACSCPCVTCVAQCSTFMPVSSFRAHFLVPVLGSVLSPAIEIMPHTEARTHTLPVTVTSKGYAPAEFVWM